MKKNITINLAGQLFAIDEDAYELLFNYTETLRRYYRRQAEGEEVVDDIESRIAELFNEKIALGYNAITIEHVQDVIQRIGNLEDLTSSYYEESNGTYSQMENDNPAHPNHLGAQGAASAAGEAVRGAWNKLRSGKHFYRDTENKILAGVLAGCAKYFGGDTVIWRLVFLLVVFIPIPFIHHFQGITGTFIIIYVILAVIAPATATPEDVLKMRGEEVTPQKLAEEVTRQNTEASANVARAQRRHTMSVIFAILCIIASVWLWLGFIGVLCAGGAMWVVPEFCYSEFFNADHRTCDVENLIAVGHSLLFILAAVASCLFILAYCTMHTGLALLDKVKSMSLTERIVWFLCWVASVIAITTTSVNFVSKMKTFDKEHPYQWERNDYNDNTEQVDTAKVDTVDSVFNDIVEP